MFVKLNSDLTAIAPTPEIIRTGSRNTTILEDKDNKKLLIQYLVDAPSNYYRMLAFEADGLRYYQNSAGGWMSDWLSGHFSTPSELVLDNPNNLGHSAVFKNSDAQNDYGTVISNISADGYRTELTINSNGVYVAKISPGGILEKNVTIATF